jgi:hypothetical protein
MADFLWYRDIGLFLAVVQDDDIGQKPSVMRSSQ